MSKVRVVIDEKALAQLRVSPAVQDLITEIADRWKDEANASLAEGFGYRMAVHQGTSRRGPYVIARVFTASLHAKRSNAVHQTLARVAGR